MAGIRRENQMHQVSFGALMHPGPVWYLNVIINNNNKDFYEVQININPRGLQGALERKIIIKNGRFI